MGTNTQNMQMDVPSCNKTHPHILCYSMDQCISNRPQPQEAQKCTGVQALALRIMSGALPGTPSEVLNYITCTPDIINFLNGEAAKGASRLQAYNDGGSGMGCRPCPVTSGRAGSLLLCQTVCENPSYVSETPPRPISSP